MRKVTYVISKENVNITTSNYENAKKLSAEMQAPYRVELAKITKVATEKSPKRQAMIEKFGRVSAKFKNEV